MTVPDKTFSDKKAADNQNPRPAIDDVLDQIASAVHHIRYGSIELTIHDGRVVQIETRAKTRFHQSGPKPAR